MNIEEYISSGILELYVLSQLSEQEAAEVEELASKYPSVREEISVIEKSLEEYAFSMAESPSESVKKKIFAKIDFTEIKDSKYDNVRSIHKTRSFSILPYLTAASVVLAILLGGTSYYYWKKWTDTESKLISLQQENITIASNFKNANDDLKFELQIHRNFLTAVRDPDSKRIELKGLPDFPDTKVIVFWNSRTNEVFIDPLKLPFPPSQKQYQLWALYDGKPIDAGTLSSARNGALQKMKSIQEAQAFAITLEKKGGSAAPTMKAMYAMGKI